MEFHEFIGLLDDALRKPLPGQPAQLQMATMRRIRDLMQEKPVVDPVRSSVLILLYPGINSREIMTVLIQRPDYDGVHGGQISLPGGKFEEKDRDVQTTAIRETEEEIGITGEEVAILGPLSQLYIPPSNYIVYPFVGYLSSRPAFHPDKEEVAEIIELKLSDLSDKRNLKKTKISLRNGMVIHGPCFMVDERIIWGATAMILNEFKTILKSFSI
jgi:8-oxo-dGTP pyrophosphatase MutT (NUDIX family)